MADLKIPNLNMKSDKYIFKKKLSLKRKTKKRLFIESALMFILSLFLVYINYLIPNKNLLLQSLPTTIYKSYMLIIDLLRYIEPFTVFSFFLRNTFQAHFSFSQVYFFGVCDNTYQLYALFTPPFTKTLDSFMGFSRVGVNRPLLC